MDILFFLLIAYILIVNVLTFILFAIDKWKAKHGKWRIPEATLLIMAAIGGSLGTLFGMKLFHHKTLHKKFNIGLPVILLLQIILIIYFLEF
jgi:Predicted membrane protein